MASIEEQAAKLHEVIEAESQKQPESVEPEIEQEADVVPETESEAQAEEMPDEGKQAVEDAESSEAETLELDAEQLAGILGLKPENIIIDDEGKIRFKGKNADATPEEYVNAFQQQATLTNRLKEVAEAKKQYDQLLSNAQAQHEQQIQQQAVILQAMENELLGPYQNIDWQTLKIQDPNTYALKKLDFDEAKTKFNGIQNQVVEYLRGQQNDLHTRMNQQQSEYLNEQRESLSKYDWWNNDTAEEITEYLKKEGFSDKEISTTADARSIRLAYHAMLYERGKSKAVEKAKKPLPKVIKPGVKKSENMINLEKAKALRKQLKKSGSLEDAVALLKATNKR